ncbi:BRCT domain-containing protein [Pseudomonas typographi]|uniref:BRCT domain-containing protein n=1 Tax=Pseudomonas typographi TaxID=2715964 RepID=UPI001681E04C|nr:BRCT domain-containing protein [Pseudomonas typographi]MBD1590180.1 NAD-dependent DNA ligase [Pseudomonas typographi]
MTDIHGEFANSRYFNAQRIDRRAADTLVGLAAGLIADNVVTQEEAVFLKRWIEQNLVHLEDPVINLLYRRVSEMLADGILDSEESSDLLSILRGFAGLPIQSAIPAAQVSVSRPTDLPYCSPLPELSFAGKNYVFTGVMAYGPRKDCQQLVADRGGVIGGAISKKVNVLVVGSVGNEQWRHASYGTKILKAIELREAGVPIAIVSEDHWQAAVFA